MDFCFSSLVITSGETVRILCICGAQQKSLLKHHVFKGLVHNLLEDRNTL